MTRQGLPISAHLALLVTLAVAAAFVLTLAAVIWLPPRPPDVMRGDDLADAFEIGFTETSADGRAPAGDELQFRLRDRAPDGEETPPTLMLRHEIAQRLALPLEKVRITARQEAGETFVFRVERIERELEDVPALESLPDIPQHDVIIHREVHEITPIPPDAPLPPIPPEAPLFAPPPPGVVLLSGFEIAAELPNGRWLVMSQGSNWAEIGWIGRAALVIGAMLALLSLLALLFARRLARPIQNFAHAVEGVGINPDHAPLAESGPRELRGAARAINAMQARLRALVADRTQTLATVAHDMRTPLMRLRLAAENVDPAQRERIAKEVGEVEALIASFIAFARDDPAEEARVRLDLAALLQSLVDDRAETGAVASFAGEERLVVTGQSVGLKRLFANLIDNALKYGGAARVSLRMQGEQAVIEIEDDGPGVPADQREAVFKPFVRLNAAAGGAGLGLPAARSIARAHGGDIVFLDAERGALVRVTLPI